MAVACDTLPESPLRRQSALRWVSWKYGFGRPDTDERAEQRYVKATLLKSIETISMSAMGRLATATNYIQLRPALGFSFQAYVLEIRLTKAVATVAAASASLAIGAGPLSATSKKRRRR